jgi:GDP-mannose 6-dehydrogenase
MIIDRGVDWILAQKKRRILFLGISFKPGTDDVRESPYVELAERLIGKGCQIRIFDPNVQLARLIGGNKEYLMQAITHIEELITPEISTAIDWAEAIVVTAPDPVYAAALSSVGPSKVVLDFARLKDTATSGTVQGFLW